MSPTPKIAKLATARTGVVRCLSCGWRARIGHGAKRPAAPTACPVCGQVRYLQVVRP